VQTKNVREGLYAETYQLQQLQTSFKLFCTSFDTSIACLIAYCVDACDNGTLQQTTAVVGADKYAFIVKHVYEGFGFFFSDFSAGPYFASVRPDIHKYIHQDSALPLFLSNLKRAGKSVFLITNSNAEYTHFVASYILGEDWRTYFDHIVTDAQKPKFFTNKSFQQHPYSHEPRTVYFGDHLVGDVAVVESSTCWDSIAVIEELPAHSSFQQMTASELDTSEVVAPSFFHTSSFESTFWTALLQKFGGRVVSSVTNLSL
jgi:hypothetical protein